MTTLLGSELVLVTNRSRDLLREGFLGETKSQYHEHRTEHSVHRSAHRHASEQPAHAVDSEGVADEPGQREQAEVEPQREQEREARMLTNELGQQADEEGDHLGVGQVAEKALPGGCGWRLPA